MAKRLLPLALLAAGAAALAALTYANVVPGTLTTHAQVALLAVGIVLLVAGASQRAASTRKREEGQNLTQRRKDAKAQRDDNAGAAVPLQQADGEQAQDGDSPATRRFSLISHDALLIPVLLLALALRLWGAGDTVRDLVDELHFMIGITHLQSDPNVLILTPMTNISPFTWLFPYAQAQGVEVFGRTLGGFRALSAFIGTGTVLALYVLARALYGGRVALAAALLLATFPPHVHFSRLGLVQITDALVGTALLALLARAMNAPRWNAARRHGAWAAAGACLGLTQYFYEGGRLFFPLLAFGWLALVGLDARLDARTGTRRLPCITAGGVLRFVALGAAVAAPLYVTLLAQGYPLTGRMDASGLGRDFWTTLLLSTAQDEWLRTYAGQVGAAFAVYAVTPEQAFYYGGHTALLLPFVVPFALVGAFAALRRGSAGALPVLWAALTALGSSVLTQSAVASRYVGVLPALPLLVALGADALLNYFDAAAHRHRAKRTDLTQRRKDTKTQSGLPTQHSALLLLLSRGALLLSLALAQVGYYFLLHLPVFVAQTRDTRPHPDVEDAVLRAVNLPPGTHVYILPNYDTDPGYARKLAAFLRDGPLVDVLNAASVTADWLAALPRDRAYAFFVEPDDARLLDALRARFPALSPPEGSPYADLPPHQAFLLVRAGAGG